MLTNRVKISFLFSCASALLATIIYLGVGLLAGEASAQTTHLTPSGLDASMASWGFMAAAISTGLSTIAAGIAVAGVGSAAIGAIAERPELFGRSLVMVGLAEGIAIYGMIISIIILNRLA